MNLKNVYFIQGVIESCTDILPIVELGKNI
jgi:hypothetical protein